MTAPHEAVKQELLVRYLDAWAASVLHRGRRATFACRTPSPALVAAALRVFGEFADLLANHPLEVVLLPPTPIPEVALPDGLSVRVDGQPRLNGAVFALFDGGGFAAVKEGDVLAFAVKEGLAEPLDPGTPYQCRAELVASDGSTEVMTFGTGSEKGLAQFKDELWALDEFAGIRLRDPGDATLLDISVRPNMSPLRRMLASHLRANGPQPVAALRAWTLGHTVYRAGDANLAVQAMLASGEATRSPVAGRLTSSTVISVRRR